MDVSFRRLIITSAVAGLIGGGLIAATIQLTTRGPAVYIPYTAMLLSLLVYFRVSHLFSFKQRFSVAFIAFVTATAVGYIYVVATVNRADLNDTPLWRNPWPIAVFVLIGCAWSTVIALAGRSPVIQR